VWILHPCIVAEFLTVSHACIQSMNGNINHEAVREKRRAAAPVAAAAAPAAGAGAAVEPPAAVADAPAAAPVEPLNARYDGFTHDTDLEVLRAEHDICLSKCALDIWRECTEAGISTFIIPDAKHLTVAKCNSSGASGASVYVLQHTADKRATMIRDGTEVLSPSLVEQHWS
jgi:hypothetical protein